MDVGSGLAILGSSGLLTRVLGPTADYIGTEIKAFVEKRQENLYNILTNAESKLEKDQIGFVSPRVLKGIIEDGTYAEDPVFIEYFGGVLASSKNRQGDDRGVVYNALISRLSSYQLRFHYLAYTVLKNLYDGENVEVQNSSECQKMEVFIPEEVFIEAMALTGEELQNFGSVLVHILVGLKKEDLIGSYIFYTKEHLSKQTGKKVDRNGIIFTPTVLGVELLLWGHGKANIVPSRFLEKEQKLVTPFCIEVPKGSIKVMNMENV